MEDWQGCLAPEGQAALVKAREQVERRGGTVITVEDFLLALLDAEPGLTRFMVGRGVDLDELVRTIQCEQPIITEVGAEGALSSQLTYWLACARDIYLDPWLTWSHLLSALVRGTERLQGKAYVAVLETIGDWPVGDSGCLTPEPVTRGHVPITVTDSDWLALAEEIAVAFSANAGALFWLRGERGAGKSSWLNCLTPMLDRDYVLLDVRRESETHAVEWPKIPGGVDGDHSRVWPILILDNTSPADLLEVVVARETTTRELILRWAGPMLLLGPEGGPDDSVERLERQLGRTLESATLPACSRVQRQAILTSHQSRIEKNRSVELTPAAIRYACSRQNRTVSTPGGLLQWVERAAARLDLFARQGPGEAKVLAAQADTLRRQSLVAIARNQPVAPIEEALDALELQKAAAEVAWHERQREGTLRTLTVADLRQELERWVAARPGPVHYVHHCEQQQGESASAGSGNLHS